MPRGRRTSCEKPVIDQSLRNEVEILPSMRNGFEHGLDPCGKCTVLITSGLEFRQVRYVPPEHPDHATDNSSNFNGGVACNAGNDFQKQKSD